MRKTYCDACEKELKDSNFNVLPVPCHLYSMRNPGRMQGYIDGDGNEISGRKDNLDLCNACTNRAYIAALKAIKLWKE